MFDETVDRVFEATFVPELWPNVLGEVGRLAGGVCGSFMLLAEGTLPSLAASPETECLLADFLDKKDWRDDVHFRRMMVLNHTGFVPHHELVDDDELPMDPITQALQREGLVCGAGTLIPLPSGEVASFTVERTLASKRFEHREVAALDDLRPHLARAAAMAARLGFERARAAVLALQAVGFPAAVLRANGAAIATNPLFEAMGSTFLPAAFGKLVLANPAADRVFRQALAAAAVRAEPGARSLAIPATTEQEAMAAHLIPLRRNAIDLLAGGDFLLVATPFSKSAFVPNPTVLMALFDLSPAEAKVAAAIAEGEAIGPIATGLGLTQKTVRTYVERIFAKTGVRRQAELVALLRSAPSFEVDRGDP